MSHHHNEHSDMHALLGRGLLTGVLLLPANLLLRLLSRLAILAAIFVGVIALTIGAYAVFTPAMPLCPDDRVPTIGDSCKARPRSLNPTRPCQNDYEAAIPGYCYKP